MIRRVLGLVGIAIGVVLNASVLIRVREGALIDPTGAAWWTAGVRLVFGAFLIGAGLWRLLEFHISRDDADTAGAHGAIATARRVGPICQECGHPNESSATVCAYCGVAAGAQLVAPRRARRFVASAVIMSVLLIGVGAWITLAPSSPEPQSFKAVDPNVPPSGVDTERVGSVGIVISRNGATWHRILRSPKEAGSAVVYVRPGGPADRGGIRQGDVITHVDDAPIATGDPSPRLWTRPGQTLSLRVIDHDRRPRQVEVVTQADSPGATLASGLDDLLSVRPSDPVLLLVRAGTSDISRGIGYLDRALEADPDFAEAYASRALTNLNVYVADEHVPESARAGAIADIEKALRLDADNVTAHMASTTAAIDQDNLPRAEKELAIVRRLDPEHSMGFFLESMIRRRQGRTCEAIRSALWAVKLEPFRMEWYEYLSELYAVRGMRSEALASIDVFEPFVGPNWRRRYHVRIESKLSPTVEHC